MADTATPNQSQPLLDSMSAQSTLADARNVAPKPSTMSTELAVKFRAACVDECADLFRACAALPGPVVPLQVPQLLAVSDVTLRLVRTRCEYPQVVSCVAHQHRLPLQIGPCIEGQSVNLETLVTQICSGLSIEADSIYVAVKNMVIQEANRKSYSHDKSMSLYMRTWVQMQKLESSTSGAGAVKRESVLESTREDLLWRWEVKRVSCLGTPVALAMRAWLKKVCQIAHSNILFGTRELYNLQRLVDPSMDCRPSNA